MKVTHEVRSRTIARLPGDVTRPFEVFVNGVPQEEDVDYEVMGGALLFDRELRSEGRLGVLRWASILVGVAGTYRQNDSVDVAYTVNGRRIVATKLELESVD